MFSVTVGTNLLNFSYCQSYHCLTIVFYTAVAGGRKWLRSNIVVQTIPLSLIESKLMIFLVVQFAFGVIDE